MAFERVASRSDLVAGRGLKVELAGVELGLFEVEGEICAIENACPHAGHPLSEGDVEGCVVVCPAHLYRYDVRTGFDPENPDGFPIPRFAVEIRGDEIFVDLTQPLNLRRRSRG